MKRTIAAMAVTALALGGCGGGGRAAQAPAAPVEPMRFGIPAAGPSLFTRLGGLDAIRAVVHDFVGRVAADERINAFFRGVDIPNLERLLVEQICQATGGPCRYTGRSMEEAHTGMNLTNAHFDALVEDLVATLNHFNVPQREQQELLGALGGMRGQIVGR
jgi:hemoglobin